MEKYLLDIYHENEIQTFEFNNENIISTLNLISHPDLKSEKFTIKPPISFVLSTTRTTGDYLLQILLNYNIFFPFVRCSWKWHQKYDPLEEPSGWDLNYAKHGFRNQELANLNANKINHFLSNLKQLVDSNPAMEWETDNEPGDINYRLMTTPTGINLNYPD